MKVSTIVLLGCRLGIVWVGYRPALRAALTIKYLAHSSRTKPCPLNSSWSVPTANGRELVRFSFPRSGKACCPGDGIAAWGSSEGTGRASVPAGRRPRCLCSHICHRGGRPSKRFGRRPSIFRRRDGPAQGQGQRQRSKHQTAVSPARDGDVDDFGRFRSRNCRHADTF
jgi:hypothetical protein